MLRKTTQYRGKKKKSKKKKENESKKNVCYWKAKIIFVNCCTKDKES